jgi:hypothetical protein
MDFDGLKTILELNVRNHPCAARMALVRIGFFPRLKFLDFRDIPDLVYKPAGHRRRGLTHDVSRFSGGTSGRWSGFQQADSVSRSSSADSWNLESAQRDQLAGRRDRFREANRHEIREEKKSEGSREPTTALKSWL